MVEVINLIVLPKPICARNNLGGFSGSQEQQFVTELFVKETNMFIQCYGVLQNIRGIIYVLICLKNIIPKITFDKRMVLKVSFGLAI